MLCCDCVSEAVPGETSVCLAKIVIRKPQIIRQIFVSSAFSRLAVIFLKKSAKIGKLKMPFTFVSLIDRRLVSDIGGLTEMYRTNSLNPGK